MNPIKDLIVQFKDTVSFDVDEGIRDSIGRKDVVTLKKMIKLERPQGDRADAKVMVLTPYRCQILAVKSPFKLEHNFHFLHIKAMDSPTPERLVISTTNGKILFMQMIGTDDADHIIGRVALSLRTIFPNVALSRILKASLEPLGRQKVIQTMLNQADQLEPGPCGNFSEMYRCICDYLNLPVREDVEWDIDTIHLSQNCHEINFKDFNQLETKDMYPIISVMIYNRWFDSLVLQDTKLSSEVADFILKVVRNSHNLKKLSLSNVGLKIDFAMRFSSELTENKESRLEILDFSNNPLEDKGAIHISGTLPCIKHASITQLNLSQTELSPRGINILCQSLRSSPKIISSLTHLNLSGNWVRSDEAEELLIFLSNENNITDLDLSSTDCSIDVLIAALAKGSTSVLRNLCLARNHFYGKKGKEAALPRSFQEFFRNSSSLKSLDFSNTRFPPDALGSMLEGLLNNSAQLALDINLASCELRSSGCQILQKHLPSLKNISSLDISDNGFDSELNPFFAAMQYNNSLKCLKIGKNFSGIKTRFLKSTMEAMVEMIQEEGSCLESLSLVDSKIREYLNTVLGSLGSNTSLTTLDISGNLIGDGGSRVLAKSLQINSKLRVLKLDRNSLTATGFNELTQALEKNYTIRHIPYPVIDAVSAMKYQAEKTQSALSRMQELLLRNADANRSSNEQQFRLQKVVSGTAQQVLDKVAEKVDDAVNALEILDADSSTSGAVLLAKNLVKDASNSKELLSDMYGLAMEKTMGSSSVLHERLEQVASEMESMVQKHVKECVSSMLINAEAQCPHMFGDISDELKPSTFERSELSPGYIKQHFLKNTGSEIVNSVSEMNLTIATIISDTVTDSLLASLSQSNLTLAEQINSSKDRNKSIGKDEISDTNEADSEDGDDFTKRPTNHDESRHEEAIDPLLPAMRRERAESVAKRRQRPNITNVAKDEVQRESVQLEEPSSPQITDFNIEPPLIDVMKEEGVAKIVIEVTKDEDVMTVEEEKEVDEVEKKLPPKEEQVEKKDEATEVSCEPKKKDKSKTKSPARSAKKDDVTKQSNDVVVIDGEFPDVVETAALDHVTKGRPRGPSGRRRAPKRRVRPAEEETDDFFRTNVSNTDFSGVPTQEEEEEIKRKERINEKMATKKMPGMGKPFLTPDMLKMKKKPDDSVNSPEAAEEQKESSSTEHSPIKRPVGAKGLPGMGPPSMGFGGDIFAEMKRKNLRKKSVDNLDEKSPEKSGDKGAFPFGPSLLKKKSEEQLEVKSPDREKGPESPFGPSVLRKRSEGSPSKNNNNNNSSRDPPPFLRMKAKSDRVLLNHLTNKPATGKPPPLPTKPKHLSRQEK